MARRRRSASRCAVFQPVNTSGRKKARIGLALANGGRFCRRFRHEGDWLIDYCGARALTDVLSPVLDVSVLNVGIATLLSVMACGFGAKRNPPAAQNNRTTVSGIDVLQLLTQADNARSPWKKGGRPC